MDEANKTSPGPWQWGAGAGKWVLVDANDKPMLSFSEWSIERGDMPLIAAAPEMLTLLRELEVCWDEHVDEWRRGRCAFVNTDHDVLTARLRAVLDKLGRAEPKAER